MSKRHTVTVEDFHFHRMENLLASGPNQIGVPKTLKFVTFPSNPNQFHYEVAEYEMGYERYDTVEDAVRRYNEL